MKPTETTEEYDERMAREAERAWNAKNGRGRGTGQELILRQEAAQASVPEVMSHPMERNPKEFKQALIVRGENRGALVTWLRDSLVVGTDFGKIHYVKKSQCALGAKCTNPAHFTKDTLFKSGAEKICGMLGVTPSYPNLARYEEAALEGRDIRAILLRCQIVSIHGAVLAEGVGARSVAQDFGDLNKALKMAKKSAHIDATLAFGGLSEIFSHPDVPPNARGREDPDPARVPAGQFKDQLWSEVSDMYLAGVVASPKAPAIMKTQAQAEISRRADQEGFDDDIPY